MLMIVLKLKVKLKYFQVIKYIILCNYQNLLYLSSKFTVIMIINMRQHFFY